MSRPQALRQLRPSRTLGGLACLLAALVGAQEPTPGHLAARRSQHPEDPLVLLRLAILRVQEGRPGDALGLLEALPSLRGGLDPSRVRAFAPFQEEPAFARIVASIRAQHPPVLRSRRVATLLEHDLQPEGLAFDPRSRAFFVGSAKGKVVRIDAQGRARDFAAVGSPAAPRWVLGLRVDPLRRQLWAVVDDPRAWQDPALGGAALHCYDLETGALKAQVSGPAYGALNDVAVSPSGDVFTTNSSDGSLWWLRAGTAHLEALLPPGSIPEANGLTLDATGRVLFVAGWHDIHRIDLPSRTQRILQAPPGVVAGSLDGLYAWRGSLIGIQNGVHPGRVLRFHLDQQQRRILRSEVLEAYHPQADGMTTGALDGEGFVFLLNTQNRSFGPDGRPLPGKTLQAIQLVRLPLR